MDQRRDIPLIKLPNLRPAATKGQLRLPNNNPGTIQLYCENERLSSNPFEELKAFTDIHKAKGIHRHRLSVIFKGVFYMCEFILQFSQPDAKGDIITSICSQFQDVIGTPAGRVKLIDPMEGVMKGIQQKLGKVQLGLLEEQRRCDTSKEKHTAAATTAEQRKCYSVLRASQNSSKEKTMAPPSTPVVQKTFDDLEGDVCNNEILVRLIHCWEARNFKKGNILMGVELLLIDSKSTTIQGFISTHFLPRFKDELKPNTIYKLNRFIVRPSKSVYRVSPHMYGISFTNKTAFAPVHEGDYQIDSQQFRIRDFQVFTDIVDKHTDLFDIIGFLRVINGDNLDTQTPMATAPAPAGERSKDMVFLHVLLEDGETARVYLWDKIAATFRSRWNDSETKPSVILLTTLNSKTLGALPISITVHFSSVVTLSSTASTRLFFDSDITEAEKLLSKFVADGETPPTVNSSSAAVTKVETVTLNEIQKFLENESPQVASFICTATITDVIEEYGWYFISCTACKWQLERSETSFTCPNFKCKKPNTVGLIRYRFEVKVRDDSGNEGTFVIFDKEALKLVVRQAPDVMNEMNESGENGSNEEFGTATPQCVLDIVGRTCKFQVKVNDFNFKSTRKPATVSRIIDTDIQNGQTLVQPTLQTNDVIADTAENSTVKLSIVSQNEKKDGKRPRLN